MSQRESDIVRRGVIAIIVIGMALSWWISAQFEDHKKEVVQNHGGPMFQGEIDCYELCDGDYSYSISYVYIYSKSYCTCGDEP